MFFENYTQILTEYGFMDLLCYLNLTKEDMIGRNLPGIAYIDESGKLAFTRDFKVTSEVPETSSTFTDNLFTSFIASGESKFYYNLEESPVLFDDLPYNQNGTKTICLAHDCFKTANLGIMYDLDLYDDDDEEHYISIPLEYIYVLFLLYICFGCRDKTYKDHIIRLYVDNGRRFMNVCSLLNRIIGKDYYTTFKGNRTTTFYIKSEKLYNKFIDNTKIMIKNLFYNHNIPNLTKYVCRALNILTEDLEYYDTQYSTCSILYGKNLDLISNELIAAMVTNGYNVYFKREGYGLYKLMYKYNENHVFIPKTNNYIRYCPNNYNRRYFKVFMDRERPIFIKETRNYLTNVSIRPTFTYDEQ